ncbi:unnamed protein product [Mytilus coruscus]|uniref:Uncharacterized protein n=1 Tax=Mytilus coruscus TaxID=42192 RepID=A0A6J8DWJ6_MYTCO|nr:unnamed protein product [Mytilus coruscus]
MDKDGPYISTVYNTKQRENSSGFRTSIERSVESEDSGLQYILPCTSETNVGLTRKIYPKNPKQPISALFGFPSFDELFDGTKKFKTVVKKVPSEVITSQEQKPCSIEVCETVEELSSTIKRMDSLMSQDFYTTLYTSWEGSNRFAEFRRKFGEALRHKYFSYCRFDDTVFIGFYVIYGMFLVCAGTYNYLSCRSDILTNIYLITDGVLSVFVFPVLVMSWKVRVGGCVNESAKVAPGTVWYSVLVARIMSSSLELSAGQIQAQIKVRTPR